MEAEIRKLPEVTALFSTVGVRGQAQSSVGDISIYVGLKPLRERTRTQEDIKQEVRQRLAAFPGMRASAQQINLISSGGFRQTPFNLILRGPDLGRLETYARNVIRELSGKPGFVDLDTAQAYRQPEVQVHIDRQKASDLGVRADAIATALRTMVGGEKVGFYREGGEQYDVRLRLKEDYRSAPGPLPNLMVPASDGRLVRLSNIADFERGMSPGQIERFAQERSVTLISNLYQKPLADAFKDAYAAVAQQKMPPEYGIVTTGRGKLLQESIQNFLIALALSLAFIYIVLAAQFESFIHPITIMVSMFLAIPFGLLTLMVLGMSLNIYSIMGLFLLMGVVKKNAILQVDYTNVLRGPRHPAPGGPDGGRSGAAPPHPHDHPGHRGGHAARGPGPRRRLGVARLAGHGGGGRADPLPARHPHRDAGDLLDVRRPRRAPRLLVDSLPPPAPPARLGAAAARRSPPARSAAERLPPRRSAGGRRASSTFALLRASATQLSHARFCFWVSTSRDSFSRSAANPLMSAGTRSRTLST